MAVAIIHALVGSIGIVAAVPITTAVAGLLTGRTLRCSATARASSGIRVGLTETLRRLGIGSAVRALTGSAAVPRSTRREPRGRGPPATPQEGSFAGTPRSRREPDRSPAGATWRCAHGRRSLPEVCVEARREIPAGLVDFEGSVASGRMLVDVQLHEVTLGGERNNANGRPGLRVVHAAPLRLVATVGRRVARVAVDPVAGCRRRARPRASRRHSA